MYPPGRRSPGDRLEDRGVANLVRHPGDEVLQHVADLDDAFDDAFRPQVRDRRRGRREKPA
jgi:hypothetical protein